MVSVVVAPRAVNSEASPTRPECPVMRPSIPTALAAAARRRATDWSLRPPSIGASSAGGSPRRRAQNRPKIGRERPSRCSRRQSGTQKIPPDARKAKVCGYRVPPSGRELSGGPGGVSGADPRRRWYWQQHQAGLVPSGSGAPALVRTWGTSTHRLAGRAPTTAARVAASAADLMVVPVRPSFVDLEATVAALERIQAVTAARVVAVLNGCATRGSDAADAEQALVDRGVLAEGAVKETGAEWVGSVVEEPEQFRISLRREDGPPNPRVASPYADWGKCELCQSRGSANGRSDRILREGGRVYPDGAVPAWRWRETWSCWKPGTPGSWQRTTAGGR